MTPEQFKQAEPIMKEIEHLKLVIANMDKSGVVIHTYMGNLVAYYHDPSPEVIKILRASLVSQLQNKEDKLKNL